MAYSELVKNFEKIRDYMREFYVYGFRTRSDFNKRSARSYDNERRRVESWLQDVMSFHQDASGKSVYISVDSRTVPHNPLFRAWKAKSFTDSDITLHFILMDLLSDDEKHTLKELSDRTAEALAQCGSDRVPDESTLRKKLKEYEELGIVCSEKKGRESRFFRNRTDWDKGSWTDALTFASETMPAGAVGSFLLDKYEEIPENLSFKHHYLLNTLDSEILTRILECRSEQRKCLLIFYSRRRAEHLSAEVYPLNVFVSTRTGRENLFAYSYRSRRVVMIRMDHIAGVTPLEKEEEPERREEQGREYRKSLWGTSSGSAADPVMDRVEMIVYASPAEWFIPDRLEREKRNGTVEQVDGTHWRFETTCCDARELLPWIRTFTGRITSLKCSNPCLTDRWREDMDAMMSLYGGDADVS